MPKGVNADGTKKARPVGSGRKAKGGKKITPKLQQDVIDILAKQRNQASYIEQAVREKYARDQETKREQDQLARQAEQARNTGQMHLLDVIEEVKQEKTSQVAEIVKEQADAEPEQSDAFSTIARTPAEQSAQFLEEIRERQFLRMEQEQRDLDEWVDMPAVETWREVQRIIKHYTKRPQKRALYISIYADMPMIDWKRSWRCWIKLVDDKGKIVDGINRKASPAYVDEIVNDNRWKETRGGGTVHFFTLPVGNEVKPPKPKVIKPRVTKPKRPKGTEPESLIDIFAAEDETINPWKVETGNPVPELEGSAEASDPSYLINLLGTDTDINLGSLF
jgi:hypothetical protein